MPNLSAFGKELMMNETEEPEFWEKSFVEKQEMWG